MIQMFEQARSKQENCLYINDLAGFCVVKDNNSTGYVNGTFEMWRSADIDNWFNNHWCSRGLGGTRDYPSIQDNANFVQDFEPENKVLDQTTWFKVNDVKGTEMGNGGNTGEFAQRFNPKALNAVYEMVNDGRVPIGLVFMNFAGVSEVEIGGTTYQVYGDRLPALIMANNFMYPLETAPSK